MYKQCYTDYVRRCLRFYSRNLIEPCFKTEVDSNNWYACHNVLQTYPKRDRDILVYVYGEFDTTGDNVYAIANKYQIHQNVIWAMMRECERQVAVERGLWYES